MKKKLVIFLAFVAIVTFFFVWGCRKEDKKNSTQPQSQAEILNAAKDFLKSKISGPSFASILFEKSLIYYLKENSVVIRIPLNGKSDSTQFILVTSSDRRNWTGNYVAIQKGISPSSFREISIRTTSFDSSRIEINGQLIRSRLNIVVAPFINLGIPGAIWLGFIWSLQEQFPYLANWYFPEGTIPQTGGGGGTGPTLYYDPYVADNVILDQKLFDSFPCIVKIIDTISAYGNLNQRAQVALNEIFNVGKKIHLTIRVEDTWTKDSIDGDTKNDSAYTTTLADGTEGLDFYSTIRLNPWVLKNATREYIASTILHEAFHAYIDFKFHQYIRHIIDSNTFKQLFPLYWPPKNGAGGTYIYPNPTVQHNAMAANLIAAMASPLWSFTNNSLSSILKDSIYRTLSWAGLDKSTVWRTKSDTCDIVAINQATRDTSLGLGHIFGPFTVGACPTSYTVSYSSLNLKMPCH
jgi:hypothetical protein